MINVTKFMQHALCGKNLAIKIFHHKFHSLAVNLDKERACFVQVELYNKEIQAFIAQLQCLALAFLHGSAAGRA